MLNGLGPHILYAVDDRRVSGGFLLRRHASYYDNPKLSCQLAVVSSAQPILCNGPPALPQEVKGRSSNGPRPSQSRKGARWVTGHFDEATTSLRKPGVLAGQLGFLDVTALVAVTRVGWQNSKVEPV